MDNIKMKKLINEFKKLDLNYLDYDGYNEVEYHDNDNTYNLYQDMFKVFVQPILDRLEKINYEHKDNIIFNCFYTDENNNIWGNWYEPEIDIKICSDNYDSIIQDFVLHTTKSTLDDLKSVIDMMPNLEQTKELNKELEKINDFSHAQRELLIFDTIEDVLNHFKVGKRLLTLEDKENYVNEHLSGYVYYSSSNSLYYVLSKI